MSQCTVMWNIQHWSDRGTGPIPATLEHCVPMVQEIWTYIRTHARTHARTNARTHARTHRWANNLGFDGKPSVLKCQSNPLRGSNRSHATNYGITGDPGVNSTPPYFSSVLPKYGIGCCRMPIPHLNCRPMIF